jgi:hypothetical protein
MLAAIEHVETAVGALLAAIQPYHQGLQAVNRCLVQAFMLAAATVAAEHEDGVRLDCAAGT